MADHFGTLCIKGLNLNGRVLGISGMQIPVTSGEFDRRSTCMQCTYLTHWVIILTHWRRFLSYRNRSDDLQSKSVDWFLYDRNILHERLNCCCMQRFIYHTHPRSHPCSLLNKSWARCQTKKEKIRNIFRQLLPTNAFAKFKFWIKKSCYRLMEKLSNRFGKG